MGPVRVFTKCWVSVAAHTKFVPWYTWCGPYDNPWATRPGASRGAPALYAGGTGLVQAYMYLRRCPYITGAPTSRHAVRSWSS